MFDLDGLILSVGRGAVIEAFDRYAFPEPMSGCWLWTGAANIKKPTDKSRRPQFTLKNMKIAAHRLSYILFVGPIPDGKMICHRCSNSMCVNPDHLYAGDAVTNAHDTLVAGRHNSQAYPRKALADLARAREVLRLKRLALKDTPHGT